MGVSTNIERGGLSGGMFVDAGPIGDTWCTVCEDQLASKCTTNAATGCNDGFHLRTSDKTCQKCSESNTLTWMPGGGPCWAASCKNNFGLSGFPAACKACSSAGTVTWATGGGACTAATCGDGYFLNDAAPKACVACTNTGKSYVATWAANTCVILSCKQNYGRSSSTPYTCKQCTNANTATWAAANTATADGVKCNAATCEAGYHVNTASPVACEGSQDITWSRVSNKYCETSDARIAADDSIRHLSMAACQSECIADTTCTACNFHCNRTPPHWMRVRGTPCVEATSSCGSWIEYINRKPGDQDDYLHAEFEVSSGNSDSAVYAFVIALLNMIFMNGQGCN